MEDEGKSDTLGVVDAETERAREQTELFADTQGAVRADALLEKLADTIAIVESDTLCNTLSDVEAKALLDMVADTVAAVKKEK